MRDRKATKRVVQRSQAQTASLRLTHDHIIPQYGQTIENVRGRIKHTFLDGSILVHVPMYGDVVGLNHTYEGAV